MTQNYGIPAFIPVQTDTLVTESVDGLFVETCLTDTLRTVAYTSLSNTDVTVVAYLRDSGYRIVATTFSLGSVVTKLRVLPCGTTPIVIWLRTDNILQYTIWNGNGWNAAAEISDVAFAMDAASVSNGCHVAWVENASPGLLTVGQFIDGKPVSSFYDFGTVLNTDTDTLFAAVAIDVAPNGELLLAWAGGPSAPAVDCAVYSSAAVRLSVVHLLYSAAEDASPALTVVCRGLKNSAGHYPFVATVLAADGTVRLFELESTNSAISGYDFLDRRTATFHRCAMESRAFRVGDEVFVWLRSLNSQTRFLIAGVTNAQRCAVADREESLERPPGGGAAISLAGIEKDPLDADGASFTWARRFESGQIYTHSGNARIGDMDFLPRLSTAKFGKSVYVAGSLVRAWDGYELGDAGFHDYPIIASATPQVTGGALGTGAYLIRAYIVRYNRQGERFQSVTVTTDEISVTGPTGSIDLVINPVVLTNHRDCKLEIYLTQPNLTTFYLVKTLDNNPGVETIAVTLDGADPSAIVIDPHGPLDGQELEESGPTGCEIITVCGDRLWSIGGQIAAGQAHFSKLYEPGEGAGWDAIAGFIIMDATGGKMTSIIGFGDFTVVGFQEDHVYQVLGRGPLNLISAQQFDAPRTTLADGAITHWGTITLPVGIAYWGANGPRLMTPQGSIIPISERIEPLTRTLLPTGVRADNARREVVWYTAEGHAVCWNYAFDNSRWARWNNLPVAGVSSRKLVTTDGHVLTPSESTPKDDGRRFIFKFATGLVRPDALLQDYTKVRSVGLAGEYLGPHRVRFEIYYDGSPMWSERFRWNPTTSTWLSSGVDFAAMTAAEIDAMTNVDRSGMYATHKRVERQTCKFLRVVVSDLSDAGFTPWELSFELGQKGGMGRTPSNTFD